MNDNGEKLQTCRGTHHLENGWVAADNEGQAAEALNAMCDTDRQLFVQILGTALH